MIIAAASAASAAVAAGAVVYSGRKKRRVELERTRRLNEAGLRGPDAQKVSDKKSMLRAEVLRERLAKQLDRRRAELAEDEARILDRRTGLERRFESIKERNDDLAERFSDLKEKRREVDELREEIERFESLFTETIEKQVGDTTENALRELEIDITEEAQVAAQKAAKVYEATMVDRAEFEAKKLIDLACHRYQCALPANRLVPTVSLPKKTKLASRILSDDRAVLQAIFEECDVEFIPQDDSTFYLQAPDPYTREIGRLAYERMVRQGNVSEPEARKAVETTVVNLDKVVRDAGRRAAKILKLKNVHPDILHLVGKLLYRTSYTQNQWQHAIETAHLCGMMAEQMGLNVRDAYRSGLMHDIGKVLWAETEAVGSHAVSGAAFATERGETPEIVHPIAAHHGDEKPSSPLAHLVAAADALSGARPGARRETLESYTQRVDDIEKICGEFRGRGLKRSYVIQGGREVRIHVDPHRVDDHSAVRLAGEVAGRIEEECIYPGQIKVTILRETTASSMARN